MTIYWNETGPLLHYNGERLLIGDLNPQIETKWRMSRWQMFKIGWRCMVAAIAGVQSS